MRWAEAELTALFAAMEAAVVGLVVVRLVPLIVPKRVFQDASLLHSEAAPRSSCGRTPNCSTHSPRVHLVPFFDILPALTVSSSAGQPRRADSAASRLGAESEVREREIT